MLASSQSGAYVCLRCQSHAARNRALAAASFYNARYGSHAAANKEILQPPQKKRSERKIYPHGKLRGKKGGEVRESSETLPVNALGKPAEIILLKDADLDRAKNETAERSGEDDIDDGATLRDPPAKPKRSSKKDILDSVKKGSVTVDAASTNKSIEELRDITLKRSPQKGDIITLQEKEKLINRLAEGFRTIQLKHYATRKGGNLLIRTIKQSDKLPHSDWRPGTSSTDERHLILTGHVAKNHISKQKLARIIIERGWQLSTDNAMQVGEMDVYDAQSFLQARDEYGNLILNTIAEARHVRMSVLTEKVVRITGDKEACMAALKDISQKCLNTVVASLPLIPVKCDEAAGSFVPTEVPGDQRAAAETSYIISLAARNMLSESDLAVLKSTTGVVAKFTISANKKPYLKLTAHSKDQLHDAQRAIYAMSDTSTRSKALFATCAEGQAKTSLGLQLPPSMLRYHDRQRNLHRATYSLAKTSASARGTLSQHSSVLATQIASRYPAEALNFKDSRVWEAKSMVFTTRLGFVLANATANITPQAFSDRDAIFTPGAPYVSPVLSYLSHAVEPEDTQNLVSFVYRHDALCAKSLPATAKGMNTKLKLFKEQLPEIRFTFRLWPENNGEPVDATFDGAEAVLTDRHYSVSMPEKAIDFSVNEQHRPQLKFKNEACDSWVSECFGPPISEMKASLQGQGRLRGPSLIEAVPIPSSWLASRLMAQLLGFSTSKQARTHAKVDYRLVGVEHRQTIRFTYKTQQYAFSIVESGKLGPRYSELSVTQDTDLSGSSKEKANEVRQEKLLAAFNTGFELVDVVDRAAKGMLGYKDARAQVADAEEMRSLTKEVVTDPTEEMGAERDATCGAEDRVDERHARLLAEHDHVEEKRAAASG